MTRQLTASSTLDNLKKEAKRWLKSLRSGDEQVRARLHRAYPSAPAQPGLRDVQHALALEHGLASWSMLKKQLTDGVDTAAPAIDRVKWFIDNACPDHHVRGGPAHVRAVHTAMRVLKRFPEIAEADFYTAIVCGDLGRVERVLAEHPEAANEKGGPKDWEPLLYLCFTRLPFAASNDNALAIARTLLDHGADPNVYFMAGDSRYTPLVGAIGEGEEARPPHPHRDALAHLLLERGAEPYDIQVVYNIHFHGQVLWFLKLIYAHSVKLGRQADWDDPAWPMLDMGGYGNGARWHLWIAIDNDDLELAEWALTHGASPNAGPPRAKNLSHRSLHENALRGWHYEMAELLLHFGATPSEFVPEDADRFAAACFALDRHLAKALAAGHPDYLHSTAVIFEAAKRDRADVVALLLDLGMSPDVEDSQKQRPLHIAAYADSRQVAEFLIDRGAEIDPVESNWSNTPLGGAVYGQHALMISLLGRYSRDVWELTYVGNVDRLREVLNVEPELAKIVTSGHTPLMWLPPDNEERAMEIAKLLLANGADPSLRNSEGQTAADRAYRLGLFDVAELLHREVVVAAPAVSAPSGPDLDQLASLAEDVVKAYNSGDTGALQRIQAYMGRPFGPDEFRRRLQQAMGISAEAEETGDLALADAQFFVARGHGFKSWADLIKQTE